MSLVLLFIAAVVITVLLGLILLPILINMKVKQTIREEGPERHLSKAGTPTMGGVIFIAAALICCIFIMDTQPVLWIWLFSFLSFGLIGFLDDFAKLRHKHNQGLSGKQKLVAQFIAVAILLAMNEMLMDRGTAYAFFGLQLDIGWLYYPLTAVFVVGMVNAVNLTDGLDGLASGVSIFSFAGFVFVGMVLAQLYPVFSQLPQLAIIMVGVCIGFLFYNRYPARVFMGDTGSMALGGAIVGLAVISHMEILLIGFGLVYLAEAISVMLQVFWFKLSGKRLFLMSPLHHHFELKGMKETKVTMLFCLASAACMLLTLLIFMLFWV